MFKEEMGVPHHLIFIITNLSKITVSTYYSISKRVTDYDFEMVCHVFRLIFITTK